MSTLRCSVSGVGMMTPKVRNRQVAQVAWVAPGGWGVGHLGVSKYPVRCARLKARAHEMMRKPAKGSSGMSQRWKLGVIV